MLPTTRFVGWLFAPLLFMGGNGSGVALGQSSSTKTTSRQLELSTIAPFSAKVGATGASQTLTLTNSGHAAINIASISLSDTVNYSTTSSCAGKKIPTKKTCPIRITFHPQTAASLPATITITDNALGSPHIVSLIGTGVPALTRTLYTFPESDNSVTPLYALINGAQKTIDMTMYALSDTTFTNDLIADCKHGVVVRVILDQNLEMASNTTAYNALNAQPHCSAVWANKAFQATHQKTFVIDGATVAIMSLNLQPQYYSTSRDFAFVENDPADIAAVQAAFSADYAAGTPSSGVAGASDFNYVPAAGDDLIWSPTTAQAAMLGIINNATKTLLVENEEMGAANIVSALEAACKRGVTVHIAMVSQPNYATNFKALEAAGCGVHVYPNTANGFYIHAKAVVADYGLSTQNVYMGSINYSIPSMTENRELGLHITDAASVQAIHDAITKDYAGGSPY
jgi:cardiolipin synthase